MKLLRHVDHICRDYLRIMRPGEHVMIAAIIFAGCLWFVCVYWGNALLIGREIVMTILGVAMMLFALAYGVHLGSKYSSQRCEVEK